MLSRRRYIDVPCPESRAITEARANLEAGLRGLTIAQFGELAALFTSFAESVQKRQHKESCAAYADAERATLNVIRAIESAQKLGSSQHELQRMANAVLRSLYTITNCMSRGSKTEAIAADSLKCGQMVKAVVELLDHLKKVVSDIELSSESSVRHRGFPRSPGRRTETALEKLMRVYMSSLPDYLDLLAKRMRVGNESSFLAAYSNARSRMVNVIRSMKSASEAEASVFKLNRMAEQVRDGLYTLGNSMTLKEGDQVNCVMLKNAGMVAAAIKTVEALKVLVVDVLANPYDERCVVAARDDDEYDPPGLHHEDAGRLILTAAD
jgi:hypothetical protein